MKTSPSFVAVSEYMNYNSNTNERQNFSIAELGTQKIQYYTKIKYTMVNDKNQLWHIIVAFLKSVLKSSQKVGQNSKKF